MSHNLVHSRLGIVTMPALVMAAGRGLICPEVKCEHRAQGAQRHEIQIYPSESATQFPPPLPLQPLRCGRKVSAGVLTPSHFR